EVDSDPGLRSDSAGNLDIEQHLRVGRVTGRVVRAVNADSHHAGLADVQATEVLREVTCCIATTQFDDRHTLPRPVEARREVIQRGDLRYRQGAIRGVARLHCTDALRGPGCRAASWSRETSLAEVRSRYGSVVEAEHTLDHFGDVAWCRQPTGAATDLRVTHLEHLQFRSKRGGQRG